MRKKQSRIIEGLTLTAESRHYKRAAKVVANVGKEGVKVGESTDDGENLYIFSEKEFSNLEHVFTGSDKRWSEIWEAESDSGGYETTLPEPYAEQCAAIRYCALFQSALQEQLLSAKFVTVVVNPNRNELGESVTALGITAAIAYMAIVKNQDIDHEMTLRGFRNVFRGIELIEDHHTINVATVDDLSNLFNSIFRYIPSYSD